MINNIELHIPTIDEYWYQEKIQKDPLTMSDNAGYDYKYKYYHKDTGCVDFPKEAWEQAYRLRIEDNMYFAYIKDKFLNEFVGYINYMYEEDEDICEVDILIENKYRRQGYGTDALKLIEDVARKDGIKKLSCSFETTEKFILDMFLDLGYEEVERFNLKKFKKEVECILVEKRIIME